MYDTLKNWLNDVYNITVQHIYDLNTPIFVAHRGIPGKKCGKIIVKAEELNNCRVSANIDPFQFRANLSLNPYLKHPVYTHLSFNTEV